MKKEKKTNDAENKCECRFWGKRPFILCIYEHSLTKDRIQANIKASNTTIADTKLFLNLIAASRMSGVKLTSKNV